MRRIAMVIISGFALLSFAGAMFAADLSVEKNTQKPKKAPPVVKQPTVKPKAKDARTVDQTTDAAKGTAKRSKEQHDNAKTAIDNMK